MISTEQKQNNHAQNDKVNAHLSAPVAKLLDENQQLKSDAQQLENKNTELKNQLEKLQAQFDWLQEQLKIGKYRHFGQSSETSHSLQLSLFDEEEPLVNDADEEKVIITYERRKKSKGRLLDTSKLPREVITHDLTDDEKICGCGKDMEKIGEDTSEQVDYVPAVLKVIEHVCPKYTCRDCETIACAKKPTSAIPKSMATNRLITEVIIEKYQYHVPLYRQSKRFKGYGAIIEDNTLGNWVMTTAQLLHPLYQALWAEVPRTKYLQADETPIKILNPSKKGYMWAYHSAQSDNRFVVFEFSLSRGGEIPIHRLEKYQGKLQTDGYSGYNAIHKKKDVISFGCWDHARRKFVDVTKVCNNNKTGVAGRLLAKIGKLYTLEREIKTLNNDERKIIRQEKAKPILDEIRRIADQTNAPPKSKLGVALTYLNNQWPDLITYIDHGEVNISNCWVENLIRPLAIGRKNWMFVGNETSANKSALLISLIQSCILNDINPRQYFIYILGRVHDLRQNKVDARSLLPQFIDKELIQTPAPGQV